MYVCTLYCIVQVVCLVCYISCVLLAICKAIVFHGPLFPTLVCCPSIHHSSFTLSIMLYEYLHRQLAYFAYVFTVGFTSRFINDDVTHNAASMHYSALRTLTMSSSYVQPINAILTQLC